MLGANCCSGPGVCSRFFPSHRSSNPAETLSASPSQPVSQCQGLSPGTRQSRYWQLLPHLPSPSLYPAWKSEPGCRLVLWNLSYPQKGVSRESHFCPLGSDFLSPGGLTMLSVSGAIIWSLPQRPTVLLSICLSVYGTNNISKKHITPPVIWLTVSLLVFFFA